MNNHLALCSCYHVTCITAKAGLWTNQTSMIKYAGKTIIATTITGVCADSLCLKVSIDKWIQSKTRSLRRPWGGPGAQCYMHNGGRCAHPVRRVMWAIITYAHAASCASKRHKPLAPPSLYSIGDTHVVDGVDVCILVQQSLGNGCVLPFACPDECSGSVLHTTSVASEWEGNVPSGLVAGPN